MSELVSKLAAGKHLVVFSTREDDSLEELKEAIERNYVHVKFTETKGGTELGFELDEQHSEISKENLEKGTGRIKLVGNIKLDYVPVRVIAEIDLKEMSGKGCLEVLET